MKTMTAYQNKQSTDATTVVEILEELGYTAEVSNSISGGEGIKIQTIYVDFVEKLLNLAGYEVASTE